MAKGLAGGFPLSVIGLRHDIGQSDKLQVWDGCTTVYRVLMCFVFNGRALLEALTVETFFHVALLVWLIQ